jgi:hypothetical protein
MSLCAIGCTYCATKVERIGKDAGSGTDNHSVHFVSVATACNDQVGVVARSETATSQSVEDA